MLIDLGTGRRGGKRGTAARGTEAWSAAMLKAKAQAERYVRALPASEGNPPFVVVIDVGHRIRLTLGDEYVETLRAAYPEVPETCDLVMYWWHKAAEAAGSGSTARFGFITTNSIVQSYSSCLIQHHLDAKSGVMIRFAIPDHP